MCVINTRDEIISAFDVSNQAESSKSFCPHTTQGFAHTTNLPPFEQFFVGINWHEMR